MRNLPPSIYTYDHYIKCKGAAWKGPASKARARFNKGSEPRKDMEKRRGFSTRLVKDVSRDRDGVKTLPPLIDYSQFAAETL